MAVVLNKRIVRVTRRPGAGRTGATASLRRRVTERFPASELLSFASIGLVCTALFLIAYDLARPTFPPLAANVIALSSTAGLNFLANRMFTFKGREGRLLGQASQYFVFYIVGLGVSSLALFCFLSVWAEPPHGVELVAALVASGLATLIRYVAMTLWVFPRTVQGS
jgi:putative flippase GtrA